MYRDYRNTYGPPLAPELECAPLSLTIYFDEVASTYPIDNLPLGPYTLKATPQTQPKIATTTRLDVCIPMVHCRILIIPN